MEPSFYSTLYFPAEHRPDELSSEYACLKMYLGIPPGGGVVKFKRPHSGADSHLQEYVATGTS